MLGARFLSKVALCQGTPGTLREDRLTLGGRADPSSSFGLGKGSHGLNALTEGVLKRKSLSALRVTQYFYLGAVYLTR